MSAANECEIPSVRCACYIDIDEMSRLIATCFIHFQNSEKVYHEARYIYESCEKQIMNVKLCNKNVNVAKKNYITVKKYLTMKWKLGFSWLIVLVTLRRPISSHVKYKNDMFTARGEDMIFSKGEKS